MKILKKGINAWCFPDGFEIEYCIKITKEAGFDGIELNMEEANPTRKDIRLSLSSTEEDIVKIKRMSEKYGLELPSISTSLCWKYQLSSGDNAVRMQGMALVRKMIDAARILGADTVLVVPGKVDEKNSYEDTYNRSLQALKELAPYAESNKVCIGVENVWNKFLLSPLEMRCYIEDIGSPYVRSYFDVGNVLSFSYPEYWIETLGGLIKKVHVKDFKTETGNITGFTGLLEGDVEWDRVVDALGRISYDSYVTAELSPYKLFPEVLIKQTSMAMDAILRR